MMEAMSTGGQPSGRLRPLGLGETLDAAIKLYRNNAVTLWKIVALVIVPLEILQFIIRRISLPSDVFLLNGTLYTHGNGTGASGTVGLLAISILGLLGELLVTGAVFKLQLDAIMDRPHDIRESFEFARYKIWSLLWLGILSTILIAVGFILLVIPGIWLMVAICVAVPALMLEGVKGFQAMKRSMSLVDGRWWATFGRLIVAFILYGIVVAIFGAIASAITNSMTNVTLFLLINVAVSTIGVILLSPFIAAVINWIYIDLRVRKEALDIEMLASGFGAPEAAPAASTSVADVGETSGLGGSESPTSTAPPSTGPSWPPAG